MRGTACHDLHCKANRADLRVGDGPDVTNDGMAGYVLATRATYDAAPRGKTAGGTAHTYPSLELNAPLLVFARRSSRLDQNPGTYRVAVRYTHPVDGESITSTEEIVIP